MIASFRLGIVITGLAVAACGSATSSTGGATGSTTPPSPATSSPSISAPASATPPAAPAPSKALIAAYDSNQNLVIVDLGGKVVATIPTAPGVSAVAAAGPLGIAYVDAAKRLQLIHQDGTTTTLQTFAVAPTYVLFKSDGSEWIYAVIAITGDSFHTQLYRNGPEPGRQPKLVVDHTESGKALDPLYWPAGERIVVEHLPDGIGGVSPFREGFVFDTSSVDLGTGALTTLHKRSDCALSDVRLTDGADLCVTGLGTTATKVTAQLSVPGKTPVTVNFAAGVVAAGDSRWLQDGGALIGTTVSDSPPFSYAVVSSDAAGKTKPWGPKDTLPEAVLGDGRVVGLGGGEVSSPLVLLTAGGALAATLIPAVNRVAAVSST